MLDSIQLLIQLLPKGSYLLLSLLLDLWHLVDKEPLNKMTASSLAVIVVPHLMFPRKCAAEVIQAEVGPLTKVVEFMILNHKLVFGVPPALVADINDYWRRKETGVSSAPASPAKVRVHGRTYVPMRVSLCYA